MAELHDQWLMLHVYILINIFTACESNNMSRILGKNCYYIKRNNTLLSYLDPSFDYILFAVIRKPDWKY